MRDRFLDCPILSKKLPSIAMIQHLHNSDHEEYTAQQIDHHEHTTTHHEADPPNLSPPLHVSEHTIITTTQAPLLQR